MFNRIIKKILVYIILKSRKYFMKFRYIILKKFHEINLFLYIFHKNFVRFHEIFLKCRNINQFHEKKLKLYLYEIKSQIQKKLNII